MRALGQLPETFDDLLEALTAYLEAVRDDPDTWRLVLMPQEGAPRLLHERIAAGRAAVVARLAAGARPGHRPARPRAHRAHALGLRRRGRAAYAQGYDVERILALTRLVLDRLARDPRRPRSAARRRDLRLLIGGYTVSLLGAAFTQVALFVQVYDLTARPSRSACSARRSSSRSSRWR